MKKIIIYLIFLIFSYSLSLTQAQEQQKQNSEPLELPNFIIQGKLQVDINTGIKQNPANPIPLNSGLLDSLNSLDKQPSILMSTPEIIPENVKRKPITAYIGANIGRYTTGNIYGAYNFDIENYNIGLLGDFATGSGHIDNAGFTKLDLELNSFYIAPQKFFIFGGSRTNTIIQYKNMNYKLYPIKDNTPLRNSHQIRAGLDVDGNYSGIKFLTGIEYNRFFFDHNELSTSSNNLEGYLKISKLWDKFLIGGNVLLDFNSLRDNSASFIQLDGSLSFILEDLTIFGNAGFQFASIPDGDNRGGFLLNGSIDYRMNKFITVRGLVRSGLEKTHFRDYFYQNPYISSDAIYDYSYDILKLKGVIDFHPTQELALSGMVQINHKDRIPIFSDNTNTQLSTFILNYTTGTILDFGAEFNWEISKIGVLFGNLIFTQSMLNDYSNSLIPYTPPMKIGVNFKRDWGKYFGTVIGLDYIGERYSDLENKNKLNSYLNLKINADYQLYEKLKLFANVENLLNSDIYLWNGYLERSMFLSVGLRYNF